MTPPVTRLDVSLPPFRRRSWASARAREVWEPRLDRLARAGVDAALGALGGSAACAVLRAMPDRVFGVRQQAALAGFAAEPIPAAPDHGLVRWVAASQYPTCRLAPETLLIGKPAAVAECRRARAAGDADRVAELLGIPECCRRFHAASADWFDLTWPAATTGTYAADADADPAGAVLLPALGLRWAWYYPCRLTCPATLERCDRLFAALGGEEAAWLRDVLAWPAEWSALHGIAEVKAPVLKVITNTDPTAERLTVRVRGTAAVEAAARGVRFPFGPPAGVVALGTSRVRSGRSVNTGAPAAP